jgi:hypothetical protein
MNEIDEFIRLREIKRDFDIKFGDYNRCLKTLDNY